MKKTQYRPYQGILINDNDNGMKPEEIFNHNKELIKKYVMQHMTYGINNSSPIDINLSEEGYYLTHPGSADKQCYVAPNDGMIVVKCYGSGATSTDSWIMYGVNGFAHTYYNFPANFGEVVIKIQQIRKGDNIYLQASNNLNWINIRFFANEWRFNE